MVASREEDFDLLGIDEDDLEASVQVFYVRKGRVVGRKGLIVDKVEDVEPPALVARLVEQLYADAPLVPKEILVPVEPEDHALYEEFLSHNRGSKVRIRVPQRGGKRELLSTATLNAQRSVRTAQAAPRLGPQRARRGRCSRCRTRSTSQKRRCASSASTSRTCRAPRSSRRWS